jgi:quinol monooxygenase YgiN
MSKWVQDRNIFLTRHKIDPTRKEEFLRVFAQLLLFAEKYYDEGCKFAFHGFARDPNEFVVLASWDESVASKLRAQPEFQGFLRQLHDCLVEPMIFEYFAGLKTDRSVFQDFPPGKSKVHQQGKVGTPTIV